MKNSLNIIKEITNADEKICLEKLREYNSVKKAVISIMLNIDEIEKIDKLLLDNKGNLRPIIEKREKND